MQYRIRVFNGTKLVDERFFKDIYDAQDFAKIATTNNKRRAYLEEFYEVHLVGGEVHKVQSSICVLYKYGSIITVV